MVLRWTPLTEGKGCPSCNDTGYRGRLAIHEILSIDDTIKTQILNKENPGVILQYAKSQGYKTLVEDGLDKSSSRTNNNQKKYYV